MPSAENTAVITACGGSGSRSAAVARSRALGKEASGRSVREADRWTCGIGVAHGQRGSGAGGAELRWFEEEGRGEEERADKWGLGVSERGRGHGDARAQRGR